MPYFTKPLPPKPSVAVADIRRIVTALKSGPQSELYDFLEAALGHIDRDTAIAMRYRRECVNERMHRSTITRDREWAQLDELVLGEP